MDRWCSTDELLMSFHESLSDDTWPLKAFAGVNSASKPLSPGKRRKEDSEGMHAQRDTAEACTYSYPELWAELPGASPLTDISLAPDRHQLAADAVHQGSHVAEDVDVDCAELPSDAEATLILLRNQLYPDPASAAAAAAAAKQTPHAKRSRTSSGPSRVTAAAVAAAAAAATAARQLPPIILKSQLYTVLADRTAVDREVEELRRNGRLRLFKLAHGADEYVTMLTTDYLSIINRLMASHTPTVQQQEHQQTAQQLQHAPGTTQEQNDQRIAATSSGDQVASSSSSSSNATNAALATTLQMFRDRIVPACTELNVSRTQLLRLLRSTPVTSCNSKQQQHSSSTAPAAMPSNEDMERHLLSVELICRDSRAADSYMFTVPGAAAFVRSVVSGRQELLQALQRKRYQEMLEKELLCVKLRSSILTPAFHIRDLQGRGLVSCLDTTAGRLVRLVKRK